MAFFYLDAAKGSYTPPRQIGWGMGFSSVISESESENSEPYSAVYLVKGYESAVTAIITDSEDDLFFLNGEFASIVNYLVHVLLESLPTPLSFLSL